MSKTRLFSIIGVGLAILLLVGNPFYIIQETQKAVLLEFGRVVRGDIPPGLHIKLPFVYQVKRFDGRIQTVDARPSRYLTKEKKAVMVDSFGKWRVSNEEQFYTSTGGSEERARALLAQRINTGLRNQFGKRTLHEVVSGERDQLMNELTVQLNQAILKDGLGFEVVDIRVKRIDLPPDVVGTAYQRMNSERAREAREHRSLGQEVAEGISANADRQRTIILAEAYRDAEKIRGEGDAMAAKIYAQAYNKDPEFYAFTRSLQAYTSSFENKQDLLIIEPDSDFFRYLGNPEPDKVKGK